MTAAMLLAIGLGLGAHQAGLALAAGAVFLPLPTAVVLATLLWKSRPSPRARAAAFCDAVAGELRAGDSLRNALESAARSVESGHLADLCRNGAPISTIADAAGREFEDIGVELRSLLSKAPALVALEARLFDEVGDVALSQAMVSREVATATAPARATAIVFLGALVWGVGLAVGGDGLAAYVEAPSQRIAVTIGLVLVVTGFALAGCMLMRER